MTTQGALQLAQQMMEEHGFGHLELALDGGKRRLGACHSRLGTAYKITLSRHWIPFLSRAELEDLILHEIAHAIAGHKAGHGPEWRRVARKIGANPNRLVDLPPEISARFGESHAKYSYACGCANRGHFHRLTRNMSSGIRFGRVTCTRCREKIRDLVQHY